MSVRTRKRRTHTPTRPIVPTVRYETNLLTPVQVQVNV